MWSEMKVCTVLQGCRLGLTVLREKQVKKIGLAGVQTSVQLPGTEVVSARFDKKKAENDEIT